MKATRRLFLQAGAALAAAGTTPYRVQAENKPHVWQNGHSPWPMGSWPYGPLGAWAYSTHGSMGSWQVGHGPMCPWAHWRMIPWFHGPMVPFKPGCIHLIFKVHSSWPGSRVDTVVYISFEINCITLLL